MISVDYIINTLEHCKFRLPFFLYTLYNCYALFAQKIKIIVLLEANDFSITAISAEVLIKFNEVEPIFFPSHTVKFDL